MKKIYILMSICILFLSACNNKFTGEEELINKARKEIQIADADTIELKIAGESSIDNRHLFWFISGNKWQAHQYTPIEFISVGKDEYEFVKTYIPLERGMDISVLMWNDGYSFIVNNPQCANIQIEKHPGVFEKISVESVPFVYYYTGDIQGYDFLDVNGNNL